jgi:hypothetical protein
MSRERLPQYFSPEFTGVMQKNFTPKEKATLSSEISGFSGDIGIKIAELQREGLGRTIGIPTKKDDPRTQGSYREVLYSLPLSDSDVPLKEKKVLLIMPHNDGYDMAVVTPMNVTGLNAGKQNERIVKEFNQIFSPSEEPYIFSQTWDSDPATRTVKTFVENQRKFFAEYHVIPREVSFEDILDEAIQIARASKEKELKTLRDLYSNERSGEQEAA